MPEPIRKTENALSIHQILELLSRPQKEEAAEKSQPGATSPRGENPLP